MRWKDAKTWLGVMLLALVLFVLGLAGVFLPTVAEEKGLHTVVIAFTAAMAVASAFAFFRWILALSSPLEDNARPPVEVDLPRADAGAPPTVAAREERPASAAADRFSLDDAPEMPLSWKSDVARWRGEWAAWRKRLDAFSWAADPGVGLPDEAAGTGGVFTSLRRGIALLRGPEAAQAVMAAVSPAPGELFGGLKEGVAAVVARQGERIQGLVAEASRPVLAEKERLGEIGAAARRLSGDVTRLEGRVEALQGSTPAAAVARAEAGAADAAGRVTALAWSSDADAYSVLVGQLPGVVDALEAAAYRLSIGDFYRRHRTFRDLRRRLDEEVRPLLAGDPESEAARHYEKELSELLGQMDVRLGRALAEIQHPGESLAGAEDLGLRAERLRARAARLKEGDRTYLAEQAEPSVQEHLRPLVDTLIRDFLSPLLQEAAPAAGANGAPESLLPVVVAAARKALAETIELDLIEPQSGVPIDEDDHEEVDVLTPPPGKDADTVASVVEPGYRWAGDLIARAKVRSYR